MGAQLELFRDAKRVLTADPALTDEQVGERCGLKPFQLSDRERDTIAAARREVTQDLDAGSARKVQEKHLREQFPWTMGAA